MTNTTNSDPVRPLRWQGDAAKGSLQLLDQTLLPAEVRWINIEDIDTLVTDIRRLAVRGAPAIGVAAAYGVVLSLRGAKPADNWLATVERAATTLATARPTAVNLFWALKRMSDAARRLAADNASLEAARVALLAEAQAIRDQDAAMCRAIGQAGLSLFPTISKEASAGVGILTHCNAGALATAEYGTALAVLYAAHEAGRPMQVFVDETRPLLQGARLTAWELVRAGINTTLICDSMAAQVMKEGRIQLVITGADRIAANGDTANKIGTYGVAVLARAHNLPFYVAAPSSTFDLSIPDGTHIPIEQRSPDEIRNIAATRTAPAEVPCYNPAFDVTPADLIRGIITERGVISPVNTDTIRRMLERDAHISRRSEI